MKDAFKLSAVAKFAAAYDLGWSKPHTDTNPYCPETADSAQWAGWHCGNIDKWWADRGLDPEKPIC